MCLPKSLALHQPTNIMKKFALFLFIGLLANHLAFAQPVVGQKYLELRQLWLTGSELNANGNLGFGNNRAFQAWTTIGMGKMLTENYSAGAMLNLGYGISENQNILNQNFQFGLQVYGRRWYDLTNKFKLHADMQAGYLGQKPVLAGEILGSDQLYLGLVPGISWFFHPRWAFQARVPLLSLDFSRRYNNARTTTNAELRFNPNLFAPNWGMTFWLK